MADTKCPALTKAGGVSSAAASPTGTFDFSLRGSSRSKTASLSSMQSDLKYRPIKLDAPDLDRQRPPGYDVEAERRRLTELTTRDDITNRPVFTHPVIELDDERRLRMMRSVGMVDMAPPQPEPEWTLPDVAYNENEDLINMDIGEKYVDKRTTENGNRLIIQDIFVENFKSYKGRQQLGPFHKNLTMILGPNGSGKSNVIDALLFVFGFKGAKIRTKKMLSLIHASQGRNVGTCKVEVHFQVIRDIDEERFSVVTESCFNVTRSVHRDNSSHYFINGVHSTHKQVHTLLLDSGIDLTHNRFLILQGEVEAIALMKPTSKGSGNEGMLEYIEDIVGTNRFVIPIAKLSHRIACLESRSSQFSAAARRHELQVEQFEEPMKNCVSYMNIKNEVNFLRCKMLVHNLTLMREKRDEIKNTLEGSKAKLKEKRQLLQAATKKVRDIDEFVDTLGKCLSSATLVQSGIAKERLEMEAEAKREKAAYKSTVKSLPNYYKLQEEARIRYEESLHIPEEAKTMIDVLTKQSDEVAERVKLLAALVNQGLIRYDDVAKEDTTLRDECAEAYAKVNEVMNELKKDLSVLEADIVDLELGSKQDEKRLADLKASFDELTATSKTEGEQLKKLDVDLDKSKKRLDVLKKSIPKLRSSDGALKRQIDHVKAEIRLMQHDQEQIDYTHHATRHLHRLKAEGGFPGFLGRLGDLGSVDKKYDVVMSTVLGCLDIHVVRTNDDSEFAINWLVENGISRTTFNAVTNMTANPDLMNAKKFPAERLFDKVTTTMPEIREAFYYFMGDMLIVENLVEAQKIYERHPGKYRIATLTSELIDYSGSVTGGGSSNCNRIKHNEDGPLALEDRSEDIKREMATLERLEDERTRLGERISFEQAEKDALEPRVKEMQSQLSDLKSRVKSYPKTLKSLERSIESLEELVARPQEDTTSEELDQKRMAADHLKDRIEEHAEEHNRTKLRLENVQQKLDTIFHELVVQHRNAEAEARAQFDSLTQSLTHYRLSVEMAPQHQESALFKYKEAVAMLTKKSREVELLACREKLAHDEHMTRMENDHIAICNQVTALNEQMKYMRGCRTDAEDDFNYAEKQFSNISDFVDEYTAGLNAINDDLARDQLELNERNASWLRLHELDPSIPLVCYNDPALEREVAAGALIVPPEVVDLVKDYEKEFIQTVNRKITILKDENVNTYADVISSTEEELRKFERISDDRGISHYCTIKTLQINETANLKYYTDMVAAHRNKLVDLRALRLEEFSEALAFLGTTTQMLYQLITNGGDASLNFVEEGSSADPFDAGIKFSVRPSKKSWKLIENLSGGEKTLASLCFVFAMHHYRSTPLYVMDEIDAALDLNNVRLIANYIKHSERTRNAQFIIISLRNQMFEVGNRLVGIYKTLGCTQNIVVAPQQVRNGNHKLHLTLNQRILAEEKKRKELARREKTLVQRVMSQNHIPSRKIATLSLREFGLDNDEDQPQESLPQPVIHPPPPPSPTPTIITVHDDTPNPFDQPEEEVVPVKKKRRRVVEEEEEEEEVPPEDKSPPPEPKPPRRSRRNCRR